MAVEAVPNPDQALFKVGENPDIEVEIRPGPNGNPEFYLKGEKIHAVGNPGWKIEQATGHYCVLTLSVLARFGPPAKDET